MHTRPDVETFSEHFGMEKCNAAKAELPAGLDNIQYTGNNFQDRQPCQQGASCPL